MSFRYPTVGTSSRTLIYLLTWAEWPSVFVFEEQANDFCLNARSGLNTLFPLGSLLDRWHVRDWSNLLVDEYIRRSVYLSSIVVCCYLLNLLWQASQVHRLNHTKHPQDDSWFPEIWLRSEGTLPTTSIECLLIDCACTHSLSCNRLVLNEAVVKWECALPHRIRARVSSHLRAFNHIGLFYNASWPWVRLISTF